MARLLQLRRHSPVLTKQKTENTTIASARSKFEASCQFLSALVKVFILRRLTHEEIRAICILVLTIFTFIMGMTFVVRLGSRTVFGPNFGADFAGYYIAGRIYNTNTPVNIYNRDLQRQIFRELFPDVKSGVPSPYLHAPFFIAILSGLAQLEYPLAYALWTLFSLGLYIGGFFLLGKTLKALTPESFTTSLLLALSFMPFIIECLAGGQTSALGFFCFAAAIGFERRNQPILSGLALSLCWYKPTLLLFILPMLVVTRRTKAMDGFLVGTAVWTAVSMAIAGSQGCIEYGRALLNAAANSASMLPDIRAWKNIDVNSFFRLLLGREYFLALILSAIILLIVFSLLVRYWWRAERKSKNYQTLLWAATITWSLVVNLFVGICDATLLVISAVLTAHFFLVRFRDSDAPLSPIFKVILFLLYVIPWVTQPIAKLIGIQLFTLALGSLGCYQLYLLSKMNGQILSLSD